MTKAKQYPTQKYLLDTFIYCESGNLFWKQSKKGRQIDKPAGTIDDKGYTRIVIDGSAYRLNRLIFIYHKGNISDNYIIDHKDGNPRNNVIDNLQQITHNNNLIKKNMKSPNTSGYRGVYWNKNMSKWYSQLKVNNKRIHIGFFNEVEEAALAYDKAAMKYHGEFAQLNFPK